MPAAPNLIVPRSVRAQTYRGPAVRRGLVVEQFAAVIRRAPLVVLGGLSKPARLVTAATGDPVAPLARPKTCDRTRREEWGLARPTPSQAPFLAVDAACLAQLERADEESRSSFVGALRGLRLERATRRLEREA